MKESSLIVKKGIGKASGRTNFEETWPKVAGIHGYNEEVSLVLKDSTTDITECETENNGGTISLFANEDLEESDSEDAPQAQKPFRGFDLEKMQPTLDSLNQKSKTLLKSATNMKKIIESAAIITAAAKGGPVPIPSKLLPFPPSEPGFQLNLKLIRIFDQKETLQDLMEDLMKPLNAGWRRELLFTQRSWCKAELVQYVTPDGTELRSMEEVEEWLRTNGGGGDLNMNNFSFHKSPVSDVKDGGNNELVYIVDAKTDGKILVTPKRREQSASSTSGYDIWPSPPCSTQLAKSKRKPCKLASIPMKKKSMTNIFEPRMRGGPLPPITCSVNCPAMYGYVPWIECQVCLCLFHDECVGLKEGVDYEEKGCFVCPSCASRAKSEGTTKELPSFSLLKTNEWNEETIQMMVNQNINVKSKKPASSTGRVAQICDPSSSSQGSVFGASVSPLKPAHLDPKLSRPSTSAARRLSAYTNTKNASLNIGFTPPPDPVLSMTTSKVRKIPKDKIWNRKSPGVDWIKTVSSRSIQRKSSTLRQFGHLDSDITPFHDQTLSSSSSNCNTLLRLLLNKTPVQSSFQLGHEFTLQKM